ncbi:testis specific X-linked gene [Rattus norvegicus]|uniref:Testis-specific protein TSX n=3 Tax=Rattus norvegicus TaxID=10116 RepID=TSX_RAT|nr:testis-specific protein TSX [Rattus norvegicus]XP_038955464.1 testis-specific protein TSX isoform X1 [Rattus norvegicus]P70537.1 RecName: Full=Testis-specific protein TSX [Rattus norvegicus]EDM07189.1 testis specific X-linked gene [Rattus norvegicus]CAA68130.1 Tsx [Rattus norvegicus]|eukprot:NP_062076.1 testis-specific protein TSX [Rattus norvegicus]
MSEEQEPKTSEAEYGTMDFPEFENEEEWLFKVLGIKPRPSSDLDDADKQEDEPLGHTEFLRLQDILQEDKVSSTNDSDTCQAGYTEENDEASHSDSDIDDNVNVIIGDIKANSSMYMEMFTNMNSQADQDLKLTESDNAMYPTD